MASVSCSKHFLILAFLVLQYSAFNVSGLLCYTCSNTSKTTTTRLIDCGLNTTKLKPCNLELERIAAEKVFYESGGAGLPPSRIEGRDFSCARIQYTERNGSVTVQRSCVSGKPAARQAVCSMNRTVMAAGVNGTNYLCFYCDEDRGGRPCNAAIFDRDRNGGERLNAGRWTLSSGWVILTGGLLYKIFVG